MVEQAPPARLIVEQLIKGAKDQPAGHLANAQLVLALDPQWRDPKDRSQSIITYDEFQQTIVLLGSPPWKDHYRSVETHTGSPVWTDVDDARCATWLAATYGIKVSEAVAYSAALVTAHKRRIHPVKQYLAGCGAKWDGQPRLDRLLASYWGAEPSDYHRSIGVFFMLGAVARICEPGCQVDLVPIAEGRQGARKSSAVRALCPDPNWFYDSDLELGNKDAYQNLKGKWIVELPELDSLSRADEKKIKAFFTSRADTYRPSYGRRTVRVERQCVFTGTTNQGKDHPYLRDETGGRRFAGFEVGTIQVEALIRDRDQLWGEAYQRYQNGEPWYAQEESLQDRFKEEQEARYKVDPWEERFADWYSKAVPTPTRLTVMQVLSEVFKLELREMGDSAQKQAAKALRRNGWIRVQRRLPGDRKEWGYEPAPKSTSPL